MTSEALTRYELKGRAAWLTLDSPSNRNALSAALVTQLIEHLNTAIDDSAVRVIVLTGAGPAFCAGADLKRRGDVTAKRGAGGTPIVELLQLLWNGPKPVIAAVNGHAFGGGIGLIAACDIAVAVETAKFSFSEVRVGVIPATISVVVVPKLGVHNTMRLFLTGERFDAAAAKAYGLLHHVVSPDALAGAVEDEIDAIAKGGPIAVGEAKRLVRTVARLPMDDAFAYAEDKIVELFASAEAAEGMAAFVGKRPAKWVKG